MSARPAALLAGALLVAAACGSSEESSGTEASTTTSTAATTTADPTTTVAAETTTTAAAETTTTAAPTTTTTTTTSTTTTTTTTTTIPPSTTTTLPGEPFEPIFAPVGAALAVAGIAFDQVLDLHALPGSDQPVVASLPPLSTGVVSEGRARLLPGGGGIWLEVTAAGTIGWTDGLLVYLSDPFDVTADVVISLGDNPTAPSMQELADLVANELAPSDPAAPPAEFVLAAAPSGGSPSEVVYDVFPGEFFGDDSSIGSVTPSSGRSWRAPVSSSSCAPRSSSSAREACPAVSASDPAAAQAGWACAVFSARMLVR